MKKITFNILMFLLLFSIGAEGTNYTWNGATSTAWNTTTNWTPNGTPGSGDYIIITASGTYHPILTTTKTLSGMTLSGGTIDLGGDTLILNSGTSSFSGGAMSNGLLTLRGTDMTFSGTAFSVPIDAIVNRMNFNGGTFNNYCCFESVNSVPGTGTGDCTFNDSAYFYHNYTGGGVWTLGSTNPNRFNGKVTFRNKSTSQISTGAAFSFFGGDIVIENSNTGGIYLVSDTLTSGHTVSIGPNGFTDGELRAPGFYQAGSTDVINLTFTGTALPTLDGTTFNGTVNISSNTFLFKNCTFKGAASLTATGSGSSSWYGGNKFYGNVTVTNNASGGNLRLDTDTANTYYANATFNGSRELRVTYGAEVSSFYGDITTSSNVKFDQGSGTLCLAGSGTQSLNFNSSTIVKNLKLNKSGGSASLAAGLTVSGVTTFTKGNLTTTNTNLLTMTSASSVTGASDSSFIDGPVKKVGNSAFVFPIGKADNYRAISMTSPAATTDAFTAEFMNTAQSLGGTKDSSIHQLNSCDYWSLARTTGSSNVAVALYWNSQTCLVTYPQNMKVCNWNGTSWNDKGNASYTGNTIEGSVSENTNNNSYTYFSLGNNWVTNTGFPDLAYINKFAILSKKNIELNNPLYAQGKIGAKGTISNNFSASDSILANNTSTIDSSIKFMSNVIAYVNGLNLSSISGTLNNQTLSPGTYVINGNACVDSTLTLSGDSNAVYIFKVNGDLTCKVNSYFKTDSLKLYRVLWVINGNFIADTATHFRGIVLAKGNIRFETENYGYSFIGGLNNVSFTNHSLFNAFNYPRSILNLITLNFIPLPCNWPYSCSNLIRNPGFEDGIAPFSQGNFINHVSCWTIGAAAAGICSAVVGGNTPDLFDVNATSVPTGYTCPIDQNFDDVRIPTNSICISIPTHSINNNRYISLFWGEGVSAELQPVTITPSNYLVSFWSIPDDCIYQNELSTGSICARLFSSTTGSGVSLGNISLAPTNVIPHQWQKIYLCADLTTANPNTLATINRFGIRHLNSAGSQVHGRIIFDDFELVKLPDAGPDIAACSSVVVGPDPNCLPDPTQYTINYLWYGVNVSDAGISNTLIANPTITVSGIYGMEVHVLDPITGNPICEAYDEVDVTIEPGLNVVVTASTITPCPGQPVTLTVTPQNASFTYTMTTGTGTQGANPWEFTVNQGGLDVIEVNDGNGCFGDNSVTINYTQQATLSASPTSLCAGEQSTLTAAPCNLNWQYNWSAGATGVSGTCTATVNAPGTYTVTIPNATNGCTLTANTTIAGGSFTPSITATPIQCNNQSNGSLSASAGASYLWSPGGATTQTISNLGPGTYTVTVTANGCTGTASAILTNPPVLNLTATKTNVTCAGGSNGSATATVSGGTGSYSYLWSNGNSTNNPTGLIAGPYTVTVTDGNQCSKTASVTVGFNNALPSTPIITGSAATCDATGVYTDTNPLAGATYTWSTSNSQSGSGNPATGITFLPTTFSSITFTVTDTHGCQNSTTQNIYACCAVNATQGDMEISNLSASTIANNISTFPFASIVSPSEVVIDMHSWPTNTAPGALNPKLIINGVFTVDHDIEFAESEVVFGPQARIVINAEHFLALEGCYLHACRDGAPPYMWDGIYVNGTTNSNQVTYVDVGTFGKSYVEDMENGIVTTGYGHVEAPVCIFNKNYKTIQQLNCPGKNASFTFGSIVECVNNPFTTNPVPANALITPHNGQRSLSGYELNNVNDIDIGFDYYSSSTSYPPMHFYNLDNGVLAHNSSASIRQCRFELITSNPNALTAPYMGFSFTPSGLCIGGYAVMLPKI